MEDLNSNEGLADEHEHDGLEVLPTDSDDLSDPAAVNSWLASFHSPDLFKNLDAFDLGDPDDSSEVDAVGDEEDCGVAPTADQELAIAALSNLQNTGPVRRRKKDDTLRNLSAEDFEPGMERLSFEIIKANVDCLFDKRRKAADHAAAAQWVFGRTLGDVNFASCCATLGTRKDVLRLRIHYEFWRRWYAFPVEFPFLIDPVPEAVAGEIEIVAGDEGYDLARTAWLQPGIRSADLLREASGGENKNIDRYRRALELLAERYLMSAQGDSWYLTGRNPMMRAIDLAASPYRLRLSQVSWSKMF
ncbi:hypothetical protein A9R05_44520 (plasmid) [Burkholderia sp. KK1]|uniref:Uncharacterized protein n=1 Tax=Burkholderia sp. M701 TaxID=326454 RepID=V5YPC5_9BURK|nr:MULTISPECIES: hypothetical protein [Burkholderia]AQH06012.1 hypothetical protein A9R05_44520 [Burkholderia sp. KK1]BAO19252.1 hypothetical protein [Burkholderia sp. M701]